MYTEGTTSATGSGVCCLHAKASKAKSIPVPQSFKCPITCEVMSRLVATIDGHDVAADTLASYGQCTVVDLCEGCKWHLRAPSTIKRK